MAKKLFLILSLCFILIVSFVGGDKEKISDEVYDAMDKVQGDEKVPVILKASKSIEKIKKEIDEENIKHVSQETIAVDLSKKEIMDLKKKRNLESIFIDKPIKAFLQDSVEIINSVGVWPIQIQENLTGIDETVCILDTGIDFIHPDLIGKNLTCIIDCINKECVENCSLGDDNGHGTHVAGIVSASGGLNGVAIDSRLIGVKILDFEGSGSISDLNAGIDWCIEHYGEYNISVISLSLGTDCTNYPEYCYDYYCDSEDLITSSKINEAILHNISVIAATGNDGNYTHISSPACLENITSVSSADKDDSISVYSNRNNITDLFAPGNNINSTSNLEGYAVMSGTSMSAPHVAGAFALIKRLYNLLGIEATPLQIKEKLNFTGVLIYDSQFENTFSRINIYSAVISILSPEFVSIPSNNISINQDNQTFEFNVSGSIELLNISFSLRNSTDLIFESSEFISGKFNSSFFYYNFTQEGVYNLNCVVFNSENYSTSENFAINYDISSPEILDMANSVSADSATIIWTTSEATNFSVDYGTSLELGNEISNSSLTENHSLTLSGLSSSITYYYTLVCCDSAGNCNSSENNSFVTGDLLVSSGGISRASSGGSASLLKTYSPTSNQILEGYTKELKKGEKIKLNQKHTLIVDHIGDKFVNLTISSEPIRIFVFEGEQKKLSLDSKDYYDLSIKLNSVHNGRANITIKAVYDSVPVKTPTQIFVEEDPEIEEDFQENIQTLTGNVISEFIKTKVGIIRAIITLIIAGFLIVIVLNFKKIKNEIIKAKPSRKEKISSSGRKGRGKEGDR